MNIKKSIDDYSGQLDGILPNEIKFEVTWKRITINHSDKYNLEKEFQNEIKDKSGVYVYSLNEIPLYMGEGNFEVRIRDHWNEAQLSRVDKPRKIGYKELFGDKDELIANNIIYSSKNDVQGIRRSINDVRFFSYKQFFTSLDPYYFIVPVKNESLRKNISKCFESFLTLHLNPVYEKIKAKTGSIWVDYNLYNNALDTALLEFESKI